MRRHVKMVLGKLKTLSRRTFLTISVVITICCYTIFAGLVLAQTNSSPRTLRVVMDNNYPPYVFQAADGSIQGILVDQWQLFGEKTGTRVEINAMNWGDALKKMQDGQFDVIDTIFKTEERTGWLDYTAPYARLEVPAFFNSEISGITNAYDLRGFAVAAKTGDAAVSILRSHGVGNLILFNSYEEIIRAAKDHKVNVFVIDKPPAMYFLYKFGMIEQYKASSPIYVGEFHRAVKKGDAFTLQEIEKGFAKISQAELIEIEKKWYGSRLWSGFPVGYILGGAGLLLFLLAGLSLWNRSLQKAVDTRTKALETSEERYRHLFNAESDAIVVIDLDKVQNVEANDAAIDLYGYSHEEFFALQPAELFADAEETFPQILSNNGHISIPLSYHRKKDGTIFPVEITARIFELENQKLLLAAMRDISDRLKSEENLRKNRRFLSDLIENSGALIFVKNRDGYYTLINRKWEEVTGLQRENVIGRTDEELFPGDIGKQFRRNDLDVIESGTVQEKEEILDGENGRRYFLSVKFPLKNDDDLVTGICGMTTEITERKQAEEDRERLSEQLAQAYRMESIGRLAGGIAHDFNNMLGVILGHTELVLHTSQLSGPHLNSIKEIEKAARRSSDLTRQLLAFARKQTVVPKVLDLNETVNGVLTILQRIIGEDIEFVWQPGESLWTIKMDPTQIDQILTNLCANARDAIESVGKITIDTRNISVDAAFCKDKVGCREGDFVVLSITDNGCGMHEDVKTMLFEPFYTTKELGKGTGLGLAMIYGIVQQNNGFITVDSKPGLGTSFKLYLPRYDVPHVPSSVEEERKELSLGSGTILLVEDEPANLEIACLMLKNLGYNVVTASSPAEAIQLARQYQEEIDLLMTDVIMPEMNGWDLAQELKAIQPDMKQLFTSGYTSTTVAQPSFFIENVHFIQKPFNMHELSVKVHEAMQK